MLLITFLDWKNISRLVPYGYRKGEKKNTIEVDPEAAEVVQKIFQWASDGITVTQIARRLNTDGIQTPSMYLKNVRGNYRVSLYWSFDSVKNILINRIYTGDTVPFKSHVVRVGSDQVKLLPESFFISTVLLIFLDISLLYS